MKYRTAGMFEATLSPSYRCSVPPIVYGDYDHSVVAIVNDYDYNMTAFLKH